MAVKFICENCGAWFTQEDFFPAAEPEWRIKETVAERICGMCKLVAESVTGILHAGFSIQKMKEWKDTFRGVVRISSCPKCKGEKPRL